MQGNRLKENRQKKSIYTHFGKFQDSSKKHPLEPSLGSAKSLVIQIRVSERVKYLFCLHGFLHLHFTILEPFVSKIRVMQGFRLSRNHIQ